MSVPYRLGTFTYKLQGKTRRMACIYTLPRVLQLRTLPPCRGGLRCCHVPPGTGLRLPAQEGSSAAVCHMALDPASVLGRALVLQCVTRLWCYHMSHGSGPCLLAWEVSSAATCLTALEPASLLGRSPMLSHVPQLSEGHEP
jgi:hypothetical protein